ncbi:MAG TPA: MqnA/MqnD/SBP family protein [Candidatus Krumholzibacteria bacterium]|jgi:1,4-dihydroxy-6-naphthoate synthase|nr:MqnA/MqnD/SBP family protein [Candidatus Krumholzibacteria bacterium]
MKKLSIGHSPDADDAFMFYGLASERVKIDGYTIDHVMEDIETLNRRARRGELDVTAISAAAYPDVAHLYRIMSCGASVGRKYGPIVLAREPMSVDALAGRRIAVPGAQTTAFMLLRLYVPGAFTPVMMNFDRIMEAVASGETDAGVIIHEGQLTWQSSGLHRVIDLGEAWMNDTALPLPLGLDVIRRGFDDALMKRIAQALKESIVLARTDEDAAVDYAMRFGRGLDRETCRQFVRMYVNADTVDMGDEGTRALAELYDRAQKRGLLPTSPLLDILRV